MIADLSANHFERHALLCGFSIDRVQSDYGYDLYLFTYNANGEIQTGDIRVQLKATDHMPQARQNGYFAVRVDRSDLALWLYEVLPVILVVYDAQADKAYWVHVQQYFDDRPDFSLFAAGQTVTIHIPLESTLTIDAIHRFAALKADALRLGRQAI